jgi:cytosine/uracil/thiamine/allantoin permease
VVFILGIFAFGGSFDPSLTTAEYALGSYWPTWILALVIGFSGPISYAPYIGDYARRISSERHGTFGTMAALAGGLFVGLVVPTAFGMFTALAIASPTESYVADLVREAPSWYVLPILAVALLGGVGQGVLCIYGTGLDLESFFPSMKRTLTTAVTSIMSICLVFFGVFAVDASAAVSTVSLILNALTVPWVAVLLVGTLRDWSMPYNTFDIQAFAQGRKGGEYWFSGGWNLPAIIAWLAGASFGVLTVNADLYTGALADIFGGIDASVLGPFLIASIIYLVALAVMSSRKGAVVRK